MNVCPAVELLNFLNSFNVEEDDDGMRWRLREHRSRWASAAPDIGLFSVDKSYCSNFRLGWEGCTACQRVVIWKRGTICDAGLEGGNSLV